MARQRGSITTEPPCIYVPDHSRVILLFLPCHNIGESAARAEAAATCRSLVRIHVVGLGPDRNGARCAAELACIFHTLSSSSSSLEHVSPLLALFPESPPDSKGRTRSRNQKPRHLDPETIRLDLTDKHRVTLLAAEHIRNMSQPASQSLSLSYIITPASTRNEHMFVRPTGSPAPSHLRALYSLSSPGHPRRPEAGIVVRRPGRMSRQATVRQPESGCPPLGREEPGFFELESKVWRSRGGVRRAGCVHFVRR